MTQALHFWTLPLPRSAAEAEQIHSRLSNEKRKQTSIFRRLAARLTERYPCITTIDPDDPRAVWSDGPLDGVTDDAVYSVGIQTDHLVEVVPFVVETATSMGLVVHDPLQGSTWLPGGTILDGDAIRVGAHLGVDLGDTLDRALVERVIGDALFPLLAGIGFEQSSAAGGLWRTHERVTQLLRFNAIESAPGFVAFDVDVVLVDKKIRNLVEQVLSIAVPGREKHVATAIGSLATMARFFRMSSDHVPMVGSRPRFEVRSIDELRRLTIQLRHLVADQVCPQLESWNAATPIAVSVIDGGFASYRIIGVGVTSDEHGITKSTYAANLLSTDRCGGSMSLLLLAAVGNAPNLRALVDSAYAKIDRLPAEQQADEKAKIDVCVGMMRENGLIE